MYIWTNTYSVVTKANSARVSKVPAIVWPGADSAPITVVNLPVWAGTTTATMAMAGAHTAGLSLPAAVLATGNPLVAANAKIITVKSTTAALLTAAAIENLTITS